MSVIWEIQELRAKVDIEARRLREARFLRWADRIAVCLMIAGATYISVYLVPQFVAAVWGYLPR